MKKKDYKIDVTLPDNYKNSSADTISAVYDMMMRDNYVMYVHETKEQAAEFCKQLEPTLED